MAPASAPIVETPAALRRGGYGHGRLFLLQLGSWFPRWALSVKVDLMDRQGESLQLVHAILK